MVHMVLKAGEGAKDVAVIEIPDTYNGKEVTEIIDNGFENLTTLQKITFSNNLKIIGAYAFRGCTSLSDVNLPAKLDTIETYAFSGCLDLKTITIPDSVKRIESCSFRNAGLEDIYLTLDGKAWNISGFTWYYYGVNLSTHKTCNAITSGTSLIFSRDSDYAPSILTLTPSLLADLLCGTEYTIGSEKPYWSIYGYNTIWTCN